MKISMHKTLLLLLAAAGLNPGQAAELSVVPATLPSVLVTTNETQAATKPVAWPHEGSDLPRDASVTYGTLSNGLRYVIQPTKSQPGQASLRLLVDVGSLYERDDEQGLAHFLEHMAFNGMRRFPAGQTIEHFQRMGMSFGAHNNAETSFETTTYIMNLPRAGVDETGEVLKYFRDVLDGMNLDAQEIEKERGIILREMSSSNTAALRTLRAGLEYALPETLYPRRFPIGAAASIAKLPRERFVEFYNAWYRPERATVIAVGDFNVAEVRRLIEREFADARGRGAPRAVQDFGCVTTGQGVTARWATVRDSSATTVSICNYRSATKKLDTVATQQKDLVETLGQLMLKLRLNKLTDQADSVISGPSVDQTTLSHRFTETSISANCEPAKSLEAVALLETELRRALQHGFSTEEFAEVSLLLKKGMARLVAQADSQTPSELANELVQSLIKNTVTMSPAQGERLLLELFQKVDAAACTEALRATWKNNDLRILVCSNQDAPAKIHDQLIEAFKKSQLTAVAAPQAVANNTWAYTDFGAPGKIVERKQVADLDFLQAKLANNVRLNIKRTEFVKDAVNVAINFGGGLLDMPADKPGLVPFTKHVFINGGLRKHPLEELNRAVADKNVRIDFAIDEEAFLLAGRCSKADLETQLQLCMAYLTDAVFRPEAAANYQKSADSQYPQLENSIEGLCQRRVANFFRGGDARFGMPDRETLRARNVEEARTVLAKPLGQGYMEVTIVGDVDPEQVLEFACKTLGTLPEREAVKPAYEQQRIVRFPKPQVQNFSFVSDAVRAMIVVAWPTADARNYARSIQLGMLSEILNDRLRVKIREELGAAYTPVAYSHESSALTDYGLISAEMLVEPNQAAELSKLVTEIAAELGKVSISDDEFSRVLKVKQSNMEQAVRGNGYWMSVLCHCQTQPQLLDDARQLAEIYRKTTKADLQALAQTYLTADRAAIVTLIPAKESVEVSATAGKEAAR
jgi:zinc protease